MSRKKDWHKHLEKADKHHSRMVATIAPLADKVREFLDDDAADVFYQTDGWCVVYGDDSHNALCSLIDFNELFTMSVEDAIEYLDERRI